MVSFFNCKEHAIPLYIGTYTNGASKGIYQMQFNTKNGALSHLKLAAKAQDPSYIAYSPDKKFIYAVGESGAGTVSAYKVEENGLLEFLNMVPSNGGAPCHISINPSGNKAVVSNYLGGSLSLYEISNNGTLNPAYQTFGYNTPEKVSHAHSAQFFNDLLIVSDLGKDSVYEYLLNEDGKTYNLVTSSLIEIPEKAGPRHFSITKDGNFIYNINEYGSSITASKKVSNKFKLVGNYSTLNENYKGANACADIHLSKNEHFVYGSNRGENTMVVFKRNTKDGTLEKIQSISVHGDWPRNFTLDPSGKFLLVANKKSNNITVFSIDPENGKLSFLQSVDVPTPVCLLF